MPTPYQLDFFDALTDYFSLTVVYFTARENDRQWKLPTTSEKYKTILLENNFIARKVQRFVSSFHFSSGIKKVIRQSEADIALVNGTYWSPNVLLALRLNKLKGHKTFYWAEPVFPSDSNSKKKIKKIFLSLVFRYADMLLAIGKKAVECYRDFGYTKPIHNIPYNINNNLFETRNLDEQVLAQMQHEYKRNGELLFLSSGSLVRRKGMDTLINAFLLLPELHNAKLIIVGDGSEKEQLVSLAGGDIRIFFVGFQDKEKIPYWFNLADVFLFASRYDGWALVVNEAMAAGKAIVCSYETGAAYDSLVHRQNALLYHADDTEGFASAISELSKDKKLVSLLSANAYQTGINLSSASMAKKLYDIYRVD